MYNKLIKLTPGGAAQQGVMHPLVREYNDKRGITITRMIRPAHEIIEYVEFTKSCEKLLDLQNKDQILDLLGSEPKLGTLVENTGGIRKLAWPLHAKHKDDVKGTIYYYYKDKTLPLHLISVFKPSAKQALAKTIEIIIRGV